jgi:hypothetical protein
MFIATVATPENERNFGVEDIGKRLSNLLVEWPRDLRNHWLSHPREGGDPGSS